MVRAPKVRASAGAASPTKPISPSSAETAAASPTATATPAARTSATFMPRPAAPAAPSDSTRKGRASRAEARPPSASTSIRMRTPLQSCWTSEPPFQITSDSRYSPRASVTAVAMADAVMPTSIPAITIVTGAKARRAPMAMTSAAAAPAPARATGQRPCSSSPGARIVAMTSASCAPVEMPNVVGSATGLRSTACSSAPDSPSAAPATSAMTPRGIRPKASRIWRRSMAEGSKGQEGQPAGSSRIAASHHRPRARPAAPASTSARPIMPPLAPHLAPRPAHRPAARQSAAPPARRRRR